MCYGSLIVCFLLASQALGVTAKSSLDKLQTPNWAYDSSSERAESQIRIRRLQILLENKRHSRLEENRILDTLKRKKIRQRVGP
jgi:hypothetical protein